MNKVLVAVLLVFAIIIGSVGTHFLFPQTVTIVEEVPQTTITWAMGFGYHYSPAVVMEHLGSVERYSGGRATLEIITLAGPAISEGLISGDVHFGQRSAPATLKDIDNGAPFKMLLSVGKKEHEIWTSDPGVQSIADLTKDNTINLGVPNSIQEIGLTLGLQRLGRSLEGLTITYLKHGDAYQVMLTGEIDAHYAGAPYTARYASEPDRFHMIATDTDLFQMELPASVVYANSSYVEANPEIVSYVISAWFEAIDWIIANPEEAAKLTAAFYEDPPENAYQDWQDSRIVFGATTGLSSVALLAETLSKAGVLERAYTAEELLFFTSLGVGH